MARLCEIEHIFVAVEAAVVVAQQVPVLVCADGQEAQCEVRGVEKNCNVT